MKLSVIKNIHGTIEVMTGLHIGASKETIEIGGLDNPIIKDPLPGSNEPYIPGSSLKGKLRYLYEMKEGRYTSKGNPCDCAKCEVCAVFGTSSSKRPPELGPTRLVVRDAHLSEKWKERFQKGELPLEIKYENSINRITGIANPRPLERVPAGVEFDFFISFRVFDTDPKDAENDYMNVLFKSMRLLQLDALGGGGSRGCGQIRFSNIHIDGEKKNEAFLESIKLN